MRTHQTLTAQQLATQVAQHKIRLPEFQRGVEWNLPRAVEYLRSMAANRSGGMLVLWKLERGAHYPVRSVAGEATAAPGDTGAVDGQQRLSILTAALTDGSPEWIASNDALITAIRASVAFNVTTGEIATHPGLDASSSAGGGWILVHSLVRATAPERRALVDQALGGVAPGELQAARARAGAVAAQLRSHKISVETITAPASVARQSFEDINTAGKPVSQDAMLLSAISGCCPGLPDTRVRPLVHALGREYGLSSKGVTGAIVRTLLTYLGEQSGVPITSRLTHFAMESIPAAAWVPGMNQVERAWREVLCYLDRWVAHPSALRGVNSVCTLVQLWLTHPSLFESDLAACLFVASERSRRFSRRSTDDHDLDLACIRAGGTSMEVLVRLFSAIEADYFSNNRTSMDLTAEELVTHSYKHAAGNYRLIFSAWVVSRGGEDWLTGSILHYTESTSRAKSASHDLEFHHVFPLALARKLGAQIAKPSKASVPGRDQLIDSVANIALIGATANQVFASDAPSKSLTGVTDERLAQQLCESAKSVSSLAEAKRMIKSRATALAASDQLNWFLTRLRSLDPSDAVPVQAAPATIPAHAAVANAPTKRRGTKVAKARATTGRLNPVTGGAVAPIRCPKCSSTAGMVRRGVRENARTGVVMVNHQCKDAACRKYTSLPA